MKAWYLLLGLMMLCAAGACTINSSNGYLPDQNPTPFLIFGHVLYEGGAPCNSPIVNITNLGTGATWYADKVSDSNYYQTLLTLADVNAGDVLKWSVTDGTVFDTTNRTVGRSDLESGGIFGFDMVLQSIAPRITGYAPESQIRDIENAARRFNVTIDQVVDVTWLVNSSPAQTNESVTDASYTHTNVAIGVWNVSARASNANGTDMQEWIWNVTTLPLPKITSFTPPSPVRDTENATRTFGITVDQVVDVTWLINGTEVSDEADVNESSYTNTSAAIGVWDVTAVASNQNGTDAQEWIWNVTMLLPPVNRSRMLEYSSSNTTEPVLFIVYGWVFYENRSGCTGAVVNITNLNTGMQWTAETRPAHYYYQLVLDAANISTGDVLQIDASKDGMLIRGIEHNITQNETSDGATMIDLNEGSVDLSVSDILPPGGFYAGRNSTITAVVVNEGTACTDGFEAALFVNGALIEMIQVPSIGPGGNRSADFNWMPDHEGNHTILVMADSGWAINETDESNNNRSAEVYVRFTDIDLVVMDDITLNKTPLDGDIVCVDVTVKNQGSDSAENFTVKFYDNNDAFYTEVMGLNAGDSDTLSVYWDASYGKHNIEVVIDPDDRIWEMDETNNEGSLSVFVNASRDFAVTNVTFALDGMPCSPLELEWGRTVTVNATVEAVNLANRDCPVKVKFYRNAYGWYTSHNINETELLFGTGNSTQYVTIGWYIDNRYSIGDLQMTAIIDPDDETDELDESNNEIVVPVYVKTCDFTITNITANPKLPIFGETVELNATIENLGDAAGTTNVIFMVNSTNTPGNRDLSARNVSVDAGGKEYVSIYWNTSETNLGGACTVLAKVDPDNRRPEINETNNTLSTELFVNGTDLDVTEIGIPEVEDLYIGDVLEINATIANHGAIDADEFVVEFYGNDTLFHKENVSGLESGSTHKIEVKWDFSNATSGKPTLNVTIDTCENPENNLANNVESGRSVEVFSPWHVDISFDPEEADEGMNVTVTATVENEAPYDRTVDVYFYANDRQFHNVSGVMIRGYITKNITAVLKDVRATFPRPDYVRSECDIRVEVGDKYPEETLQINPPENLTVLIDPPANAIYNEIVDVNIRVTNNGDETAKTTLWFYDVNESYYEIEAPSIGNETLYILYPGASNISLHLDGGHDSSLGMNPLICAVYDKYNNQIFEKRRRDHSDWNETTPWGAGDAVSIYCAYKGTNVTLNYIALLDTIPLTIPAHGSQEFKLPWRPPLGEHTLWARVSSANNSTSTPVTTQDLWVADISVDSVVSDGDLLNVTATIENIGNLDAGEFMVSFSNDSNVFCVRNLSGNDMSGGDVEINALWEASTWNESEAKVTLDHTISVEVDPCENFDGNKSNNIATEIVRVDPSRDFSVAHITFVQDAGTNQTTIGALIKNFGRAGSTNISILVDKWGKSCSVYSTSLRIDGERYVNVEWNASVTGDCSIIVMADPDNRTLELNESNNCASRSVYIEAPDFIVKSLVIDPFDLVEGDAADITVTVANVGDRPANASLAVYDYRKVSVESFYPYSTSVGWQDPAGTRRGVPVGRGNATAMRLYLDYETFNEGFLRLYDSKDRLISVYTDNFIGWTDWVVGDNITAELEKGTGSGISTIYIHKYDYLTAGDIIDVKNTTFLPGDVINITVNWSASTAGERSIVAIVDSENVIPEPYENNSKSELLTVQGADLIVSDIQLTVNGTEINDTLSIGTVVNISATVANIGILPASGFNVSFMCDDIHDGSVKIANVTSPNLDPSTSTSVFATWNVTDIGDYMLEVMADPENNVFETSELNNTLSKSVVVRGPDLSVTDVTFEVVPPDGADTNVTGNAVYDTDTVLISAVIENQGIIQAGNFSTHIFYEYEYLGEFSKLQSGGRGVKWIHKSYDGAECIYINITNLDCNINGRIVIYDGNGTEVARPNKSCWIPVMGDAANVRYSRSQDLRFIVDFHAGNITKIEGQSLAVGESMSVSRIQRAGTGDHPVIVCVDPENNVGGDPDGNNYVNNTMCVLPSRDFIPEMRLIHNGSEIGVNDTVWGGDTVTVDTRIRMGTNKSDPYSEYREGIVNVTIIDEHEWVDASPRYEMTSYGYAYNISYPGADEMRLHFNKLDVSGFDFLEIRDGNGTLLCTVNSYTPVSPWLSGDKVYVYRVRKETRYGVYRHIECSIDKYQYRKINRSTVKLTANKTANISLSFTPSAGAHTICVITDPDDEIGELNESNNMTNATIDVKACRDPAAVNIMFSPDKPHPGDAVNVTATVTNNGNRTATFMVDLSATKYEHRPCESPHYCANLEFQKNIITYPEANWTGVHFTKISTNAGSFASYLHVCDRYGEMSEDYYGYEGGDVWTWVRGDLMEINTRLFCTREGDCIWGFDIDTVAHKVTLNKTPLTLHPGETASINGILPDVRIGHRSIGYTVTASVDHDHIIFETDESNNVISRALIASCPDLTVGEDLHFTGDGKARAKIKNDGTYRAEDVEVRFGRDAKFFKRDTGYRVKLPNDDPNRHDEDDIDAIRVHFQELTIRSGSLRIRTSATGSVLQEYTSGDYDDTWSDWVTGDHLCIYYDRGVDFTIDRYAYAKDETPGDISARETRRLEVPWTGYEEPYNLTIDVDSENDVIESNEDNNNETIEMGADMFVDLMGSIIPDYLEVDHPLNFFIRIENIGTLSTPEFNVTLYANITDDEMVPVESHTIEVLNPRDYCYVRFEWEPPTDRRYRFIIRADPEDQIVELNEKNNELDFHSIVFKDLGYGGSSLETYADGEVNGSFVFKMGDRVGADGPEYWYQGAFGKGHTYEAEWDVPLPADASIEIGRLYLYWGFTKKGYTHPTEFNVEFNGHLLAQEPGYPDYSDYPIEKGITEYHNFAYGVYGYDVKDYVTGADKATVTICDLHGAPWTCIAGMSLVIIYESDEGILTKYWINEGADVLAAAGADLNFSSLFPNECTTEVVFKGDADSDELSNATLITVVPWGNQGNERVDLETYKGTEWAGKRKNGLYFNGKELKDGAYKCDSNVNSVWIDERDVKDDLVKRDNVAEIQDRGDMMVSANGFLILRYPPDLNVINLTAPASTVVGARHPINVTIRNDGKGGAHDFNVTFHIDGKQMVRIPHLDLPAGENMTIHLYNWTPMLLVHVYNLTAAADVLSGEDWTEIETDNNAMTKRVLIEEGGFGNQTGPRGTGGGSNPTGGEYTEKITGKVMQGMKEFLSFGGGGGAGMFSLTEWIMKGAVWLVLMLFVCTGYWMEQRSYRGVRYAGFS